MSHASECRVRSNLHVPRRLDHGGESRASIRKTTDILPQPLGVALRSLARDRGLQLVLRISRSEPRAYAGSQGRSHFRGGADSTPVGYPDLPTNSSMTTPSAYGRWRRNRCPRSTLGKRLPRKQVGMSPSSSRKSSSHHRSAKSGCRMCRSPLPCSMEKRSTNRPRAER